MKIQRFREDRDGLVADENGRYVLYADMREKDELLYVYENTPFAHWHERAIKAEEQTIVLKETVHKCQGMANEINILTKENKTLTTENEQLRKELADKSWRLRDSYSAFLHDAAKQDNCRNCVNMRPATLKGAADRISCKYVEGWPHWSTKCDKWEKQEILRGEEVKDE